MQVEILTEVNPGPAKRGRIEVQASTHGELDLGYLFATCSDKARQGEDHDKESPLVQAGYRLEKVLDGAGVANYNLYVMYDLLDAPEIVLNPRNLNSADQNILGQTTLGQTLSEPSQLGDIGLKEKKF